MKSSRRRRRRIASDDEEEEVEEKRTRRRRRSRIESDDEEEEIEGKRTRRLRRSTRDVAPVTAEEVEVDDEANEDVKELDLDGQVDEEFGDENDEDYEKQLSQERGFNEGEMNDIVGRVMNFILQKNSKKIPVKMSEVSNIIKTKHRQAKLSNHMVMKLVKKRFLTVFGYELRELPRDIYGQSSSQGSKRMSQKRTKRVVGTNTFILMNANRNPAGRKRLNLLNPNQLPINGLLMTVFSFILLNKGKLTEIKLWDLLNEMGLYKKTWDLRFGGTVEKLFGAQGLFVKQRYLKREKKSESLVLASQGEPVYEYMIGRRGLSETSRSNVFKFAHKVLGKKVDEIQLQAFLREEEQEEEDKNAILASQSQR